MIKFFRHIRRSLIQKNQMGKYFKYAIGEILLVVIGILIALQINNWNENRKLIQKEKEVLLAITSDLDFNIKEINLLLNNQELNLNKILESLDLLVDYLEADKSYNDSLRIHFTRSNSYYEVNLKNTAYESLTSIGIDLIQDTELRSKIGDYFTSAIVRTKNSYTEMRDDYYNYMLFYYRHDFIQTLDKENNTTLTSPRNYEELKQKNDYVESLKVFMDVNLFYKREAIKTLDESKELKTKIKTYIQSL